MTLKAKFSIGVGISILITGLILSLFFLKKATNSMREELKNRGIYLATTLAHNSEIGVATNNIFKTLDPLVDTIKSESDILYVIITNVQGKVLAHSNPAEIGKIYTDNFTKNALQSLKPTLINYENTDYFACKECHIKRNKKPLDITMAITAPEDKLFKQTQDLISDIKRNGKLSEETKNKIIGVVRIGISTKTLDAKIKNDLFSGLNITFGLIIICMLGAVFLTTRITNPLKKLVETTKKISAGDLSIYTNVKTTDEVGQLAGSFNKMIKDLKVLKDKNEEYNRTLEQKIKEKTIELQKAYLQLLHAGKMTALGQIAGGLAHEINNPMGVILGFAQSIAKGVNEDNTLYMPLKSIEREALRCKKLIEDILTFSRMSKTAAEETDINTVIDESLSLVNAQAKVKNVQIKKEYGNNLSKLMTNRNQIQQVIINLCNNAMDSMPDGGTIKIATRSVIASETKQSHIEISITDTGTGIPKEIINNIFEPFFTTKEVGKGTGLGLSLCHEIIQRHNGTIEVESELKKGTTFIIKLPIFLGANK